MAMAATLRKRHSSGGVTTATFSLVASGNYSTGGDSVDFAPKVGFLNKQPEFVDINGKSGFIYSYDAANKKVISYCVTTSGANTALGEVSAGAYPAGITGDTIRVICTWVGVPASI